ncbi:ATP-binding cassette domain-containing protein [Kribbella sp. VKM Ac-2568]|uniref:ATP-binding cassette domain-containing protein n=1 Tax=Kribbella sp. VKM Ac-2568 TaxID=2512219 RepID=UPI00104359D4|nr:ATP-binding cassette domain-containing protein [Kribbella sp. VKM Ac-2568]TCM44264.1 ABC-2 type transport system ATP-binding protein [Kribbella sp. VKM Ac-2568]
MITVSGLTKHYGKRLAVHDMTFEVAPGRVTGFVGPNGAGKSTTMRMMVGLTRPDSGDVSYHGIGYTSLKNPARIVGSVLDARCMRPGRTARNHLRATAALSGVPAKRAEEVLAEVGLETAADQRVGGFSLGMRQRLALAGALLGDPEILLLDEPSNGLDPNGIRWLRTYLRNFADRGGTVFVSSHLIAELSMFADDLVVVGGGRLLAAESVDAISARSAGTVIAETPQAAALAAVLASPDVQVEIEGDRLEVRGTTKAAVSQIAFDHGIRLVELTETSRSLEDSLLDLTRASAEFASA